MTGTDDEAGDLKVAHLRDIYRGPKTEVVSIDGDVRIIFGQQIAVRNGSVVQGRGEGRVGLCRQIVLLPCFEGIVADEEQGSRLAGERVRREVMRWPFDGGHRLYKRAFAFFMQAAGFARFDELAHDNQN